MRKKKGQKKLFNDIEKAWFKDHSVYFFMKDKLIIKGTYNDDSHYKRVIEDCIKFLGINRVVIGEK